MNKPASFLRPPAAPAATPVLRFLTECHAAFLSDKSGAVADYIPELSKADPDQFGISIATIDGHVYETGDSDVAFTIQSISKAYVFALALEMLGHERVEAVIGVEPSGEAFNSIRLRSDHRPFNPMVNAGAIACSGLIVGTAGQQAFECIHRALCRFAGRELGVDDAVFESERATGDRNRAIGYLLRNHGVIAGDVNDVLDVYFRQCSIQVTARDLAVMGATLANYGINPVTGERVVSPYAVARTLSVMTSAGMYDFAGEWIYRVGIPAKSGVGGGIVASLPGQFGLGTFSPLLDSYGNSVRGLKLCEAVSSRFELHVLNHRGDVRTGIIADYYCGRLASYRSRRPHEQRILDDNKDAVRVIELAGALTFATVDYLSRRLASPERHPELLVLDLHRVPALTEAAGKLLAEILTDQANGGATLILAGMDRASPIGQAIKRLSDEVASLRIFSTLDAAIDWAEDQVIFRRGGFGHLAAEVALDQQQLLAGLAIDDISTLAELGTRRTYQPGELIVALAAPSSALYFVQRGMASARSKNGTRLSTMVAGTAFGELALIGHPRSADVWADTSVLCIELTAERFEEFRRRRPHASEQVVRNLAILLAERLSMTAARIDLLRG